LSCKGLYSGNDYFYYWDYFLNCKFDEHFEFGDFLGRSTLGCEYYTNGSILKELLPNGIGLVFKLITSNDITYEFIIKMSLVEIEEDSTRVTYDKDKSKITVDISSY
jgi:hypothetical protein